MQSTTETLTEPNADPRIVTVSEAMEKRLQEKGELWHSPFTGERRISHIDERMWAHDHEQHDPPAGISGRSWCMHGGQELRYYPSAQDETVPFGAVRVSQTR